MKFKISAEYLEDKDRYSHADFRKFDIITKPSHFCSEKAAQKYMDRFPVILKTTEDSNTRGYGLIYFIREDE